MRLSRSRNEDPGAPGWAAGNTAADSPNQTENWTSAEPVQAGWVTRTLLWCGGVDRQLLVTRAEVYRYSNLGLLVIAVAALGATSFTLFATVVLNHFYLWLIPFAFGWGLLILLIDRSIITEPLYHERQARAALQQLTATTPEPEQPDPASPNGATPGGSMEPSGYAAAAPAISVANMPLPAPWKSMAVRGGVYLARIVIAICLAFLVAETIILLIFNPEVKAQLTVLHAAEFKTAVNSFAANQKSILSEYQANLKTATKNEQRENSQVNGDRTRLADEGQGVNGSGLTGQKGYGPQYRQDRRALNHDTRLLDKYIRQVNQDTGLVAGQQTFITGLYAQDPKTLAEPKAGSLAAQKAQIYANDGFAERERAFQDYLKSDQGDVVASTGVWALRILLISIDLLPLGAKLLNPYTIYGRRLSERALAIRYHDLLQQQALLRGLDQQAALQAMWSAHNYRLEQKQASWRSGWRMNHMRDS